MSYTLPSSSLNSKTLTHSHFIPPNSKLDPLLQPLQFKQSLYENINSLIEKWKSTTHQTIDSSSSINDSQCLLFPAIQMGRLGIRTDEFMTTLLLQEAYQKPYYLNVTSGYLNFGEIYADLVAKSIGSVLTASPKVSNRYTYIYIYICEFRLISQLFRLLNYGY